MIIQVFRDTYLQYYLFIIQLGFNQDETKM